MKLTRYRAYGLEIECERELPLRPGAAAGEADLRVVPLDRSPKSPEAGPDRRDLSIGPAGWTLRYDNRDGDWMAYEYRTADRCLFVSASLSWEICAGPLAGVVCAVLLGLRGRTLLHGACLELGGAAFALLGASGHGKSTLAAALAQEGAKLVTEDLLVAAPTPAGWTVEAGALSLHLLADAFALLGPPPDRTRPAPRVRDGKYALDLPATAQEAAPLARIYILDSARPDTATRLTRLAGRQAVQAIVQHLYGAAWIRAPDEADLRFCAGLAAEIPVYLLSRPWRLEQVAQTAALLRRHALSEPGGPG